MLTHFACFTLAVAVAAPAYAQVKTRIEKATDMPRFIPRVL